MRINREWAIETVRKHIKKSNLLKHVIAVGGCMRRLAQFFNQDEVKWEIAGILHDLDYEYTNEDPRNHPEIGVSILRDMGFDDEEILNAILAHNNKAPLRTLMDKALYLSDPTSGFIVACALILPQKNLDYVDTDFMLRRFREKGFAKGASREQISQCKELLNLELSEFLGLCLEGLKLVRDDLDI